MSEDQVKELRAKLVGSVDVMERLMVILEDKLIASYHAQRSISNYEDPNWALKQADFIGRQRCYKEILDLVNFKGWL